MILNVGFILIVSIAVASIVLKTNFSTVMRELRDISVKDILLIIALVLLWQFFAGLSLTAYARRPKPDYKIRQGFLNAVIGMFFDDITPSSSGGQVVQFFIFRRQGLHSGEVSGVLWTEFLMYQTVLCTLGSVLFLFRHAFFKETYSFYYVFYLGLIAHAFLILGLFLMLWKGFYHFLTGKCLDFLEKIRLLKDKEEARERLAHTLEIFKEECRTLRHDLGRFFLGCLFGSVRLTLQYSIPYAVFLALGEPFHLPMYLTCLSIGAFVHIISGLLPVPGASGGAEALFVLMFSAVYPAGTAMAAMLIWRLFSYYMPILTGLAAYVYYKVRN